MITQFGGKSLVLALAAGGLVVSSAGGAADPAGEGMPPADLRNVRFHPLLPARDLPPVAIGAMVMDGRGTLWVGTGAGLWRFHQTGVTPEAGGAPGQGSLRDAQITALAPDSAGSLWVGTNGDGLHRIDVASGSGKRRYPPAELPGDQVLALLVDLKGDLWVGTERGLAMISGRDGAVKTMVPVMGEARVSALAMSGEGEIWIGLFDGRLFSVSRETGQLTERWEFRTPVSALAGGEGTQVWIGTQGDGLHRYDPSVRSIVPGTGLAGGEVSARLIGLIHRDSRGHLWVSTAEGLVRVDTRLGRHFVYRHDPEDAGSIPGHPVSALCEDARGGLWLAADGGRVSRIDLQGFGFAHVRVEAERPGPAGAAGGTVSGFFENPDGSVWVASEAGLGRWRADQGWIPTGWSPPEPSPKGSGWLLQALRADAAGRLWLGTRGDGVLRYDPDGTVHHLTRRAGAPAGLPHDSVSVLHEDARGQWWVGSLGGGLARWMGLMSPRGFLSAITEPAPGGETAGRRTAACRHVTAMAEDSRGRTWVGSWEGLFLLDTELAKLTHYRSLNFPAAPALTSDAISALFGDSSGFLWVGTVGQGLNRFDPATGEVRSFSRAGNGLPDDRIAAIEEDARGFLWISTAMGIGRLDPASGEVRRFDTYDGLQKGPFHPGAVVKLRSGAMLFGGADGFNLIDPERLPPQRLPQPPVLAGLELSGAPVLPGPGGVLEKPLAETERLKLSFEQGNRLIIKLNSGDLAPAGPEYFRYRLVGQDLVWNVAGPEREAIYTSLRPGKYAFEAQSSSDGRNWNEQAARLAVVIKPPAHLTWWAYLLYVAGGGLSLWGGANLLALSRNRYHRRLLEKAEQQRDRAEAELARQLQHALLLDQAGKELGQHRDARDLFENALKIVARQFDALRCTIVAFPAEDGEAEAGETLAGASTDPGVGAGAGATVLADYRGETAAGPESRLDRVSARLAAALRDLLEPSELAVIPWDSPATATGPLRVVAEEWSSPEGGFILRRTAFLDERNGAILLRRSRSAVGLATVDLQMLESLANQIGIAIAQWQVARKERQHRDALDLARRVAESANRAKSDFLAKMTHELRTPLNAILGFSEVMNEDTELNDRQREVMAIINNSGEHLHEVINGVLDLAKIEAGRIEVYPARFEMERMLRSMHKMLSLRARSKGLDFPLELLTALPRLVETDKGKLRQILINLVGNAIKFTETGSVTLSVWAEVTGETVVEQGLRRRPLRLHFEVRDTGQGIAPEEREGLFEQFTQTESGKGAADSTGLGLSIAKAFVELLGGAIGVESAVGEGTVFRLHIACEEISAPAEAAAAPATPLAPSPGREGIAPALAPVGRSSAAEPAPWHQLRRLAPGQPEMRILIAEDLLPNRLLLRKHLEPAGFLLREAEDGLAAVEMWRTWHPHLILMDEQMPRMTGREATRAIMAEAEESGAETVPVIVALTAFALDQSRSAAIEAGCSDFLAKPFRRDELFGVISRNLPQLQFDGGADGTGSRDRERERDRNLDPSAVALAG